jgi:hypothetical protein
MLDVKGEKITVLSIWFEGVKITPSSMLDDPIKFFLP